MNGSVQRGILRGTLLVSVVRISEASASRRLLMY